MKKLKPLKKWVLDNKRVRLFTPLAFMAIFAVVGVFFLIRSFAAGERLYVTPPTSSVQTGNDITVSLRLNGGVGMNAVDAIVNYDQAKLQFKSIDTSSTAFGSVLISEGGNGRVNVARFVTGSTIVTGDVEIAKITFTAIAASAGSTALTVSGQATNGENSITLSYDNGTVNITAPSAPARTASFTMESTVPAPTAGAAFGLRVYANASDEYEGGQVTVTLPAGLSYNGTLDTTGSAFNPATTVTGTTAQIVNLVFVTQSTTLTGKQLVATIPVNATTAGAKQISFSGGRLVDLNEIDITPLSANPFSITVNSSSLPAPIVSRSGRPQISATENITDLRQAFSISNYDSGASYTISLGGQNLTHSNGSFSIPASTRNGDLSLVVSTAKNGSTGGSSYTIRLRSPNVNRIACVELLDLLAVNGGYGRTSNEFDLNFDGTVTLVDLLTVTGNWGGACV